MAQKVQTISRSVNTASIRKIEILAVEHNEPKKESWYQRHFCAITCLTVLFILLIGAVIGVGLAYFARNVEELDLVDENEPDLYGTSWDDSEEVQTERPEKPKHNSNFTGPAFFSGEQVRLAGWSNSYEGRVEIKYNGIWGTVCDDHWDIHDADVVCKQLGFTYGAANAYTAGTHGWGTGPIWMDNVNCDGTEASLGDCSQNGWGIENCEHFEDASVLCLQSTPLIRLVNGNTANEGRVEVQFNGIWGTVCDRSFGTSDAKVVCNTLGYFQETGHQYVKRTFGRGAGSWITNVGCSGTELSLFDCYYTPSYCPTRRDVGVRCAGSLIADNTNPEIVCPVGATVSPGTSVTFEATATDDDDNNAPRPAPTITYTSDTGVDVSGGTAIIIKTTVITATATDASANQASCQFTYTVSGDSLDTINPVVTCKASTRVSAGTAVDFHATVTDVNNINEATSGVTISYSSIPSVDLSGPTATIDETTSITCTAVDASGNSASCTVTYTVGGSDSTVRLAGITASVYAGRVEILRDNVWGTICDDYWGMEEATVVCRQLGYASAVAAYNWQDNFVHSQFGDVEGTIWLDDVQCTGNEDRIEDCFHAGWGVHNCPFSPSYSEEAGVMCYNPNIIRSNDLLNTGTCGTRGNINRIVGGIDAVHGEWPWIASIRDTSNYHRCGASLISPKWAITAAHCVDVAYKVVLGDLKVSVSTAYHQESLVTVFSHPHYDEVSLDSDFALLKLNNPVSITDYVRPVCLEVDSTEQQRYPAGTCKAVGWGRLEYQGSLPTTLQEVDLSLITKSQCLSSYGHITDNMICTDVPRYAGTCQGDSGGPLNCLRDGKWHLLGATSHGYDCGLAGIPEVFTRISAFWQFIKQTVDMNGGP